MVITLMWYILAGSQNVSIQCHTGFVRGYYIDPRKLLQLCTMGNAGHADYSLLLLTYIGGPQIFSDTLHVPTYISIHYIHMIHHIPT